MLGAIAGDTDTLACITGGIVKPTRVRLMPDLAAVPDRSRRRSAVAPAADSDALRHDPLVATVDYRTWRDTT